MMKQLFLILSFTIATLLSYAQNTRNIDHFVGQWSSEFIGEDEMQNSSFELYIEKDSTKKNAIIGWHCSEVRGGRKIDCFDRHSEEPSLHGYLKNDTMYIHFISSFGGKGQAKLYFDKTGEKLIWELGKYTIEHYLPDYETLEKTCNIYAQEIDFNNLDIFFNRINSGQLLPGDHQTLEYLRQYERDSLIIHKTFEDKNGENHLCIKVANPCSLAEDNYRVDGWINYIVVRLNNKNYSDTLIYYNPCVAMSLINLIESNITLKPIAGKQAVFIPFAYCGNADDEIRITYIVFYDYQKYVYHINLRGQEYSNYKIADNLDEKLKGLPSKLKKEFIKLVQLQYKSVIAFEEEQ